VNIKMMQELGDDYGYIFWAPYEEVKKRIQLKYDSKPPIVQWGSIRGYLLQTPTLSFIFRYKDPKLEWAGNPIHSHYPLTPEQIFEYPINDQLKEGDINWCPQVYGQPIERDFTSLDDMLNSEFIGPFQKPLHDN
jgi:hypothetical protein